MVPKSVDPTSWGWSGRPGTDQGPLCTSGTVITEHTVDWRWARSVPASDCARATEEDTTLCDEPVSTTKLAPRAAGEADGDAERHVTRGGRHGQRHRRAGLPLRQRRRRRARRARIGRGGAERRALGAGQDERTGAGREVDADPAEAGQDVGAEQADRLPLAAHLGQRGGGELLRRQDHPVERPRAHRDGLGGTGAPDAGELARWRRRRPGAAGGPGRRRWSTAPPRSRARRGTAPGRRCRRPPSRRPGRPRRSP